jgi:hypothetical protein
MADTKITALTAITTVDPAVDVLPIVDVSDTTMAASGTTKKITSNQILGAGGTATLASATITGDLTVDTSTLKVDSTNNRVIVGHTSGSSAFQVTNAGAAGLEIQPTGFSSSPLILSYNRSGSAYTQLTLDGSTIVHALSGTTAMTLNSTGLGVGATPTSRLTIGSGSFSTASANTTAMYTAATGLEVLSDSYYFGNRTGGNLVTITSSGNVGVGVTPSAWVSGSPAVQLKYNSSIWAFTDNSLQLNQNAYFDGAWKYINSSSLASSNYYQEGGNHRWRTAAAGTAGNAITWTTPMSLDTSGNLLVARTGAGLDNTSGVTIGQASIGMQTEGNATQIVVNRTTSDGTIVDLRRNNSSVGNISVTTSGATFNSTSDYRLKELVAPLNGGLARVNALKPSVYKWKSNGSAGEGFLAHELAEVVPAAVNGEKDAVNDDGSIKAQSIDMSRVVPILVAAIKELTARVQTLEAR